MAEQFQIGTDNASDHLILAKTLRLFDRTYYNAEEIGEVIDDGLKAAIKMVRQIHLLMTSDPCCMRWIDGKLLYDLTKVSDTIMDVRTAAMIALAEKEREEQAATSNDSTLNGAMTPFLWTNDDELRQAMQEYGVFGVEASRMRQFLTLYHIEKTAWLRNGHVEKPF